MIQREDYQSRYKGEEIDDLLTRVTELEKKQFVKSFTKSDFKQVGSAQKYFLAITKKEHGLTKPYGVKVIVDKSIDENESVKYSTAITCGARLLSTGTIKIYVTIDLSQYTEYSGKIYLKGE